MTKVTKKIGQHQIVGQDINKKVLGVAIDCDMPVLLIGETGTGKTSMVRELATDHKAEWVRFNLTGETTVDEFVGKYELEAGKTVWKDGILLDAMKSGKWLIVDEINVALPEILFVLHSLLDDDKFVVVASHHGEVVRPHADFRFFATMNPTEEYAGTKELNKAFQSRFNVVLEVDYADKRNEINIVADKCGVTKALATKMVDVALAVRKAKLDEKIFYTCSTRDLLHWGNLTKKLDTAHAFQVSVLNKSNGDKAIVGQLYKDIMGKYATLEKKVGTELSIDQLAKEFKKLEDSKSDFEVYKRDIKKKVADELVAKLTDLPAVSKTVEKVVVGEVMLDDIKF